MIIDIFAVKELCQLHIVSRREYADRHVCEARQDLCRGTYALDRIGPSQYFVHTTQNRCFIRRRSGIQNPLEGADLHNKITLSASDIVPQCHGSKDPAAAVFVRCCGNCTNRLRKNRGKRRGFKERRFAGCV